MKKNVAVLLYVGFFLVLLSSCWRETSPAKPNQPPTTTLANIPVDGDTLFALVELQWDGGDVDGYVAGYEYTYTTHYLFRGDSAVQDWTFVDGFSDTIAFNSSDSLNKQRFRIRAVDNDGARDPNPPSREFYTIQTVPPKVEILQPADQQEMFVIPEVTDWYWGVELSFEGTDADGEIVEYAWAVDNGEWQWTQDTTLYITPDQFGTPLTGQHVIRVTARDNTNIINPQADSVVINLVEATFEKDILIIDETNEREFPSSAATSDSVVDRFYSDLFGTEPGDSWDYEFHDLRGQPLPSRNEIGQYKLVVWHADNRPENRPHNIPLHEEYLKNYLNVGGNFILSGWRVLKSFAWDRGFPVEFGDTSFVNEYLHIVKANESPFFPADFSGATGRLRETPDLDVDSTKLAGRPFNGKLNNINIIVQPAGFTEVLYRYDGEQPGYRGQPCGLKYTGTSFQAVVLGFPLYFIKKEDAQVMVEDVVRSMGIDR